MTVLPYQLPAAGQWELVDYGRAQLVSGPAAGGKCRVEFEQVPPGELWLVDRIVVSCTSAVQTTALIYEDVEQPGRLRDGTPTGNLDTGDMASPLQVPSGSGLIVVWLNATAGAIGTAYLQWSVLRQGEG